MDKFIRIKDVNDEDLILNTRYIIRVYKKYTRTYLDVAWGSRTFQFSVMTPYEEIIGKLLSERKL